LSRPPFAWSASTSFLSRSISTVSAPHGGTSAARQELLDKAMQKVQIQRSIVLTKADELIVANTDAQEQKALELSLAKLQLAKRESMIPALRMVFAQEDVFLALGRLTTARSQGTSEAELAEANTRVTEAKEAAAKAKTEEAQAGVAHAKAEYEAAKARRASEAELAEANTRVTEAMVAAAEAKTEKAQARVAHAKAEDETVNARGARSSLFPKR
jgi:hypothetical protein